MVTPKIMAAWAEEREIEGEAPSQGRSLKTDNHILLMG